VKVEAFSEPVILSGDIEKLYSRQARAAATGTATEAAGRAEFGAGEETASLNGHN
jgi:hypothetical protein